MKLRIIQFATLLLLLLVTGVFWGTWFSLSRSIEVFTPAAFLEIGKAIIKNVAWPMRIMMPTVILLMLINLWLYPVKRSKGFFAFTLSLVLLLVTLLITLSILVPLDNQIKQWTLETVPGNWEQLRDKWECYHMIRTFTCIGSFTAYLASALFFRSVTRVS